MGTPKTLQEAIIHFSDADRCFQAAVAFRWPDGLITCPRCESDKNSFVKTRKLWHCKGCKKQFTVKVGTIFEDSPIGLDKWMCAMWMLANCKNGVSSYEIHRSLGVTQKTAWFMLHRIRMAMQDSSDQLSGVIEMDETFVGGKLKNMHKSKRPKGTGHSGIAVGAMAKTIVVGMLERGGRVKAQVVKDRTKEVLHGLAKQNVQEDALLITDEWSGYREMKFERAVINHAESYVRGQVHTNGIENFWSCLKRSLGGTYISTEPFHLFRYIDEQAFRFNHRKNVSDSQRMAFVMGNVAGKRLTYADLTGANGAH